MANTPINLKNTGSEPVNTDSIWFYKAQTADRVRRRIGIVLKHATSDDLRERKKAGAGWVRDYLAL
ncbi:MAG: hypothetical protein CMK36_04605 [Porticoccaceae bacterium]|nr:hypothetical protein [Porticoccaceae bacterium]|tara:strand:+ start:178 stop:375 length:198 start_codon:yes stop_codon:yes gene_type:complete